MNMLHFFKYFGLCMKRGNGSLQEQNYLGLLLGSIEIDPWISIKEDTKFYLYKNYMFP